jgi:hypothetical protein
MINNKGSQIFIEIASFKKNKVYVKEKTTGDLSNTLAVRKEIYFGCITISGNEKYSIQLTVPVRTLCYICTLNTLFY